MYINSKHHNVKLARTGEKQTIFKAVKIIQVKWTVYSNYKTFQALRSSPNSAYMMKDTEEVGHSF